jgi:hypothetical protein
LEHQEVGPEASADDDDDDDDDEDEESVAESDEDAAGGAAAGAGVSKVGELMRSSRTTSSQCSVCGNMSTAIAWTGRKGVPIIVFDSDRQRLAITKQGR